LEQRKKRSSTEKPLTKSACDLNKITSRPDLGSESH